MRKLLLVALMAVSACAWADVTDYEVYALDVSISDVPYTSILQLPQNTIMQLVDTRSNTALITLSLSELDNSQAGVPVRISSAGKGSLVEDFWATWNVTADSQEGHTGNYVHFVLANLKWPKGVYQAYIADQTHTETIGGKDYTVINNLELVISGGGKSQSIALTLGGSQGALSAGAVYSPGPVPEPTSAMLLLLGVTGLMLKRKRA